VAEAAKQIREKRVTVPFKSVLMLDEFQDVNADAFALIEALYEAHDGGLRMIAVGDDDQCIMQSVNGADIAFFERFIERFGQGEGGFARYTLLENYRSDPPILAAASGVLAALPKRIKSDIPRSIRKGGEPVDIVLVEKEANLAAAAASQLQETPENESVAFLAYTNETTAEIYSALYARGFRPAYIAERAGFKLANLAELRRFTLALHGFAGDDPTFDPVDIAKASAEVRRLFEGSTRLETFKAVLNAFVKEYDEYYFTLWESFLSEISFEEFEDFGKLVVSTMHKSKGREFDRVVAVVPNRPHDEEWLRLLYVAFTRAKHRLTIVTDDHKLVRTLQSGKTDSDKRLRIHRDTTRYSAPAIRTHMMSLRDVALGFSHYDHYPEQQRPVAGALCELDTDRTPYYLLFQQKRIERLSKNFTAKLERMLEDGWHPEEIVIDAIAHWYDVQNERDTTHVLAKVIMSTDIKKNQEQ
jgi:ATP-dependent DNA helicase RecQ